MRCNVIKARIAILMVFSFCHCAIGMQAESPSYLQLLPADLKMMILPLMGKELNTALVADMRNALLAMKANEKTKEEIVKALVVKDSPKAKEVARALFNIDDVLNLEFFLKYGFTSNALANELLNEREIYKFDDDEMAVALLRAGADPNSHSFIGNPILFAAAGNDAVHVVEVLLKAHADPDILREDMDLPTTPLMAAASNGNVYVVNRLLKANARTDMATAHGKTAFDFAKEGNWWDVMKILKPSGPQHFLEDSEIQQRLRVFAENPLTKERLQDMQKLFYETAPTAHEDINNVIKKKIEKERPSGEILLTQLASQSYENVPLVSTLLSNGVNPNVIYQYSTPLNNAVHMAQKRVILLLLAYKANPFAARTSAGTSAYHEAASGRRPDVLRIFLDAGMPVDFADEKKNTALIYAAKEGDIRSVRLLLRAGANTALRNSSGKTAAEIAQNAGRSIIADIIQGKMPALPIAKESAVEF